MAVDVRKVLASAIANAENNHNLDVDALVVKEASVGKCDRDEALRHPRAVAARPASSSRSARLRIVVREQEAE